MKNQEQRSSFITIAINNANSAAVAAMEAGEWEVVVRTGTGGCEGLRLQEPDGEGETGAWEGLSPGRVGDPWDPIGLWDSMLLGQARPLNLPGLWRNTDFFPPCLWSDSIWSPVHMKVRHPLVLPHGCTPSYLGICRSAVVISGFVECFYLWKKNL